MSSKPIAPAPKIPRALSAEKEGEINMQEKTQDELLKQVFPEKKIKDWPSFVLMAVAFVIWIGGLIVAVMSSVTTTNISSFGFTETHFSLQAFLGVLIPYLLYGAICLFLAEVCKKLNENKQKS